MHVGLFRPYQLSSTGLSRGNDCRPTSWFTRGQQRSRDCVSSGCVVEMRRSLTDRVNIFWCRPTGAAKGAGARPKLGSQKNSWLRRWAKYTKLCMVWQPNILNNCYELSGGCAPRTTHQGLCPGPRRGTSVPQTPCAPTSKSCLRHCVGLDDLWHRLYWSAATLMLAST